jgi:hypothetical protein
MHLQEIPPIEIVETRRTQATVTQSQQTRDQEGMQKALSPKCMWWCMVSRFEPMVLSVRFLLLLCNDHGAGQEQRANSYLDKSLAKQNAAKQRAGRINRLKGSK